jgi:hypothetical protein
MGHWRARLGTFCALAAAVGLSAATGATAADYNEATLGDLSGVAASPTPWTLAAGANLLTGEAGNTFVNDEEVADYDLVAFTVPAGHQLDTITIPLFTVEDRLAFIGLQAGTPWNDELGNFMSGNNLMGWALLDTDPDVEDLINLMLPNGPDPDATGPLAAGVYTMVLQDVDAKFQYSLSFNVSATGASLPGDFDGNGVVNAADVVQWRGDFGLNADSNADGDGDSDGNDFVIWQRQLAKTSPTAHAIPEPHAAVLAALALAALAPRSRGSVRRRARR